MLPMPPFDCCRGDGAARPTGGCFVPTTTPAGRLAGDICLPLAETTTGRTTWAVRGTLGLDTPTSDMHEGAGGGGGGPATAVNDFNGLLLCLCGSVR